MALDQKRLQKPARKLRKSLKKITSFPDPEDVHRFRTDARTLETVIETFSLSDTKNARQLAKEISKLRRRAGKVRDLDVLTDYVSGMPRDDSEGECSVRLLEHLGSQRARQAKKLHDTQQRYFVRLRRRLKNASKMVENMFPPKGDGRLDGKPMSAIVSASALALLSQLREPPQLRRSNLHEYRLKVKELRNLLKMAADSDQQPFVDRLGEVKDAIGEWHDWEVLVAIAKDVLNHGRNCRLMERLQKTAATKYKEALHLAEAMRREDLRVSSRSAGNASRPRRLNLAERVWSATASLTA